MNQHHASNEPHDDGSPVSFGSGGARNPYDPHSVRRSAPQVRFSPRGTALAVLSWLGLLVGVGLWLAQNPALSLVVLLVAGVLGVFGAGIAGPNRSGQAAVRSMFYSFRVFFFFLTIVILLAIIRLVADAAVDGVKDNF